MQDLIATQTMLANSYNTRGIFIQRAIEIEKIIEYYISSLYCKDENKRTELILIIISPLNFAKKIEVFLLLLHNHNPDFISQYKSQLDNLTLIKDKRNVFAHWPLDFSENGIKDYKETGGFTLVKFKPLNPKQARDILEVEKHLFTRDNINSMFTVF